MTREQQARKEGDREKDTYLQAQAELIKEYLQRYAQIRSQGVTVEQLISDLPEQYRVTVRITVLHFALLVLLEDECGAGMITEEQHNELTTYLSQLERLASLTPLFSIYNMPMEEAR